MDKGWMDCCEQATAEANKRIIELEAQAKATEIQIISERHAQGKYRERLAAALSESHKETQAYIETLEAENAKLRALLEIARCPDEECIEGGIPYPTAEGWEQQECQFCHERKAALDGDENE
jgi:hypothetical protein